MYFRRTWRSTTSQTRQDLIFFRDYDDKAPVSCSPNGCTRMFSTVESLQDWSSRFHIRLKDKFGSLMNPTPLLFWYTLAYQIIVQQTLLIFWKIPSCTALFHPARLLILGNFKPKPLFLLIKMKNSNLHGLIPSCTFIKFWKFSNLHTLIPTCTLIRFWDF